MITIKTKVNVETEVNIELETPCFYKNSYSFMGVFDESVINIFQIEGKRTFLSNDSTENAARDIAKAYKEWEHISEEEFFENLDKALKDFDFKPTLSTKSIFTLTPEEQEERDRDREEERVNDYYERELDQD